MANKSSQQNAPSNAAVDRGAEIAALGKSMRLSGFDQSRTTKAPAATQAEIVRSLEELGGIKRDPNGGERNASSIVAVNRDAEIAALAESMRLSGFEPGRTSKASAATQAEILQSLENFGAISREGRGSPPTRRG